MGPKNLHNSPMYCLLLLSTLVLLCSKTVAAFGHLDHGDSCDPSPSQFDEAKKCDSNKRLSCDPSARVCRCHHESRDIYDPTNARCETRVGKSCISDNVFPTICVDNAVCNSTTLFCECQDGYMLDPNGGQCSGSVNKESNVYFSSLAMFVLLISVFICT